MNNDTDDSESNNDDDNCLKTRMTSPTGSACASNKKKRWESTRLKNYVDGIVPSGASFLLLNAVERPWWKRAGWTRDPLKPR